MAITQGVAQAIEAKRHDPKPKLTEYYESLQAIGAPIDYNGQTYHIQLRDKDQQNLRWFMFEEQQKLAAGVPSTDICRNGDGFKVYENVFLPLTINEFLSYAPSVEAYTMALYKAKYDVEQQITAGTVTDAAQVPSAYDTALAVRLA